MLNNKQFKIIKKGEVLVGDSLVAEITLCDNTVWKLTDYMFIEWFTQTTKQELIDEGWEEITN